MEGAVASTDVPRVTYRRDALTEYRSGTVCVVGGGTGVHDAAEGLWSVDLRLWKMAIYICTPYCKAVAIYLQQTPETAPCRAVSWHRLL